MEANEVLKDMAKTFEDRNGQYGNNYLKVGPIMKIMFPEGVHPDLLANPNFHLFELTIVKLTRFAISGLKHKDSAHDAAIYCAMMESNCINQEINELLDLKISRCDDQYPIQRQKELK